MNLLKLWLCGNWGFQAYIEIPSISFVSLISDAMSCVEMLLSHVNYVVGTLLSVVCFGLHLVDELCSYTAFMCA